MAVIQVMMTFFKSQRIYSRISFLHPTIVIEHYVSGTALGSGNVTVGKAD